MTPPSPEPVESRPHKRPRSLTPALRPCDRFIITVLSGDRQFGWSGRIGHSHLFIQLQDAAGNCSVFFNLPYLSEAGRWGTSCYVLPHVPDLEGVDSIVLRRHGQHDGDAWLIDVIEIDDRRLERQYVYPVHRWVEAGFDMRLREYDACLPQDVLEPELVTQRATELVRKRPLYEYTQIFRDGPVQLYYVDDDLPFEECYSFIKLDELTDELNKLVIIQNATFCSPEKWSSFAELEKSCENTLDLPHGALHWNTDMWFGIQRLQGVNAKLITLCTAIPDKLGIDRGMLGLFLEGLTLDEAIAAKRIFMTDLHILEGIQAAEKCFPSDYVRELCAPIALFYLNKEDILMPVAIQLFQMKGRNNPVFLPSDPPNLWLLAKMFYNCAEAQHHTVCTHMGQGRLLMEGVAVCTQRNLSPSHPLYRLLAPHFQFLMITNALTVEELLEPGMWMYDIIMLKSAGVEELMRRGVQSWGLDTCGVIPRQVAGRGVADPDVLPYYPYRDDACAIYTAIESYVRACLQSVYTDEARLAGDWELLQWRRELTLPTAAPEAETADGGLGLRGVPGDPVTGFSSLDELVDVATAFIATVTVGHAAATFGLYDEAGFVPSYPLMLQGRPPRSKERPPSTADLLDHLPSRCHTWFIMLLTRLLSSPLAPPLARPRQNCLLDPASMAAAAELRAELERQSERISRRNAAAMFPYRWLEPLFMMANCVPRAVLPLTAPTREGAV